MITTYVLFSPVPTLATIELDRSIYMASEGVDTVQICAVISEPADLLTLDPAFQANLILSTTQDSAIGTILTIRTITPMEASLLWASRHASQHVKTIIFTVIHYRW